MEYIYTVYRNNAYAIPVPLIIQSMYLENKHNINIEITVVWIEPDIIVAKWESYSANLKYILISEDSKHENWYYLENYISGSNHNSEKINNLIKHLLCNRANSFRVSRLPTFVGFNTKNEMPKIIY